MSTIIFYLQEGKLLGPLYSSSIVFDCTAVRSYGAPCGNVFPSFIHKIFFRPWISYVFFNEKKGIILWILIFGVLKNLSKLAHSGKLVLCYKNIEMGIDKASAPMNYRRSTSLPVLTDGSIPALSVEAALRPKTGARLRHICNTFAAIFPRHTDYPC